MQVNVINSFGRIFFLTNRAHILIFEVQIVRVQQYGPLTKRITIPRSQYKVINMEAILGYNRMFCFNFGYRHPSQTETCSTVPTGGTDTMHDPLLASQTVQNRVIYLVLNIVIDFGLIYQK